MSGSDDECSAAPLHTNDDVAATPNIEQYTSNRAVDVVLELQPNDVLVGRGARVNALNGNVHFRNVIQRWKGAYQMATTKGRKQEIASIVVAHVKNEQGRFLRPIVHQSDEADALQIPDGVNAWVEVEHSKVIEKAKQALRERGHTVVRGDRRFRLTDSLADVNVGVAASADGAAAVDVSTFGTGDTSSFAAPPPPPPPPHVSMVPQNFIARTLLSAPSRASATFPLGAFGLQAQPMVHPIVGNDNAHLLPILRDNYGTGPHTSISNAAAVPGSYTTVPSSAPHSSLLLVRLQEEMQRERLQLEIQSRMTLLQQMEQEAALQRQRQLQMSLVSSISSRSNPLPLAALCPPPPPPPPLHPLASLLHPPTMTFEQQLPHSPSLSMPLVHASPDAVVVPRVAGAVETLLLELGMTRIAAAPITLDSPLSSAHPLIGNHVIDGATGSASGRVGINSASETVIVLRRI